MTTEYLASSEASARKFRKSQLPVLLIIVCLMCDVAGAGTSRLYPPNDEETGGLRLTQIMAVASRDEILKSGETLQHLLASGLKDSDLKDGTVAMGRIYCCHASTEQGTAIWFYVPFDLRLNPG